MREETRPVEILLAEDNDDDVVLIQEAFAEGDRLRVTTVVKDGEETMAYLRREGKYRDASRPALLVLDINMPRKNGLEVLREVKGDPSLRGLPVIVLTTSDREEDVAAAYREGACSFITKPVGFRKFQLVMQHFESYWTLVARIPEEISN